MAKATKEDVLAALDRVIDPASGKSVTESGLVQGLVLRDGNVGFAIEVPEARGREAEPLRKACEDAVGKVPGVLSVTAVLTAHHEGPPVARPHSHAHADARAPSGQSEEPKQRGIPGVASVIAVASGKGGVGKSTVAVNLALGLAHMGLKTGLLDADVFGPSVPRLLAITEQPRNGSDHKVLPIEKFGLKVMSIGFFVAEGSPVIFRGPMVQSALRQMMNDVAWAPLDVLVVDMPPGTGEAQLTMAQEVPLKGAVIVSTPQDIALIDARKGIAMFQKTAVPILGIVENMSVFVCPECGHASHIFGHGGARATAKQLNVPFLSEIPLVPAIRETSDAGTPIVVQAPNSREAQAFLALAQQVGEKLASPVRAAPRIVME
jgi:ATP-binding protein involved in chromosome partitioning